MRKIITTALGVSLIAASTVQMAAAAERHHRAHKVSHVLANQQFRDAQNSLDWPASSELFLIYNNNGS